ncbi:hypothetical protein FEM48_Zijuj12G0019600 [Ziziphus jujuba var. spinosa]|uniref:Pentatricopeptide repeat-containing protein At4g35130, chloroplastic-like n=1 Tax=Ziziphus jujuba var. spinosa TaxID=714518 RepID=A0A978UAJ3_ZIZJJ|nr:hypothetical protein FEM48_Zijuj12G0019600 [Ziziphus jujuba var. spinosa]
MTSRYHNLTTLSSSSHLVLNSCRDLQTLKQLHARFMVSTGVEPISLASKLITFYTQFNDLESAVSVFNRLRQPNTSFWNLIIKSHVEFGHLESAFLLYRKMHELGVAHDVFTFAIVNKALSLLRIDVLYAGMVHCLAIQMGFVLDVYFGNTMIELYVKCGCVYFARKLFDEMCHRDLVSWTAMISGYVSEGNFICALNFFREMRMLDLEPNAVTMMVVLQGCCGTGSSIYGRQLHCYLFKNGLLMDGSLQNSILKMYTKLGTINEVESFSREVDRRRDVVYWNVLISFYSSVGDAVKAIGMFNKMRLEVETSIETLTSVISAVGKSGNLFQGEKLHCLAIKSGHLDDVLQTSLLDLYAKCGELGKSERLFKEIRHRNNITWSAIMSGFIQNGYFNEAVELFHQMQATDLEPSSENLRNLVDAYTNLGALQLGKRVHGFLIRNIFHRSEVCNTHLETSLLNMYIRCGSISSARVYFNKMLIKDVVTWTSMIEGYGSHGLGVEALRIFDLMIEERIAPNRVTFLSLLSACSHSGLVIEGCEVFSSMKWKFGIDPDLDHYTCMVDLLGRYGKLKEALVIIMKLIALPDSRIWGALFSASRVHHIHRELGEYAAQKLLELELDNIGYYTLLSNAQASIGQWNEVEEIRRVMKEKEMKKKPGWSCIENKGRVYGFVSGDRSHHQTEEIYGVLGCLSRMIKGFR